MSINSRITRIEKRLDEQHANCPKCFGRGPVDVALLDDDEAAPPELPPCPDCGRPAYRVEVRFPGMTGGRATA